MLSSVAQSEGVRRAKLPEVLALVNLNPSAPLDGPTPAALI